MKKRTRTISLLACTALLLGISGCNNAATPAPSGSQPTPTAPAASATPAPSVTPAPEAEGLQADVLVIGGGLCGLTAAIAAQENGASVILVEKQGMLGGSSSYSGGSIGAAGTRIQKEHDIEDTAAAWEQLWTERSAMSPKENASYPDMERVDWLVRQGPGMIDWLESVGVKFAKPNNYGIDLVERLHGTVNPEDPDGPAASGSQLILYLADSVATRDDITVMLNTKATGLIETDGKITGAVVEGKDGAQEITAGAVVLATGGFAASPELLQRFVPGLPEVTCVAAPGATGDGILMAETVGAGLYEDPWVMGLYTGVAPGSPLSMLPYYAANLYVAPDGKRVMNEGSHYSMITNSCIEAGGVLYMIVDSSTEAIFGQLEQNLSDEHVFKGETYEELAQAAGIDPAAFVETMNTYNGYASSGVDAEFGKDASLLYPVATAPYYALKVMPNIMATIGGVKTLKTGEVLDSDGKIIPGLYAGGETSNRAIYNQVYITGSSLANAATSGQYCGISAADYVYGQKGVSAYSEDMTQEELAACVAELKAKDEIRDLQNDYWWYMDTKQWEKWGDVFTEDMVYYMNGNYTIEGRDNYVEYVKQSLADMISSHQAHQQKIVLTSPTTAVGRWVLNDILTIQSNGMTVEGYGYYINDYEKGADGKWRIKEQRLGYFRTNYGDAITANSYEIPYPHTMVVD